MILSCKLSYGENTHFPPPTRKAILSVYFDENTEISGSDLETIAQIADNLFDDTKPLTNYTVILFNEKVVEYTGHTKSTFNMELAKQKLSTITTLIQWRIEIYKA